MRFAEVYAEGQTSLTTLTVAENFAASSGCRRRCSKKLIVTAAPRCRSDASRMATEPLTRLNHEAQDRPKRTVLKRTSMAIASRRDFLLGAGAIALSAASATVAGAQPAPAPGDKFDLVIK